MLLLCTLFVRFEFLFSVSIFLELSLFLGLEVSCLARSASFHELVLSWMLSLLPRSTRTRQEYPLTIFEYESSVCAVAGHRNLCVKTLNSFSQSDFLPVLLLCPTHADVYS